MRTRKPLIQAVVISLLAHILFFASATGIKITGIYAKFIKPQSFFNIKTIKRDVPVKSPGGAGGFTDNTRALKFESPVDASWVHSQIKKEEYTPKAQMDIAEKKETRPVVSPQDEKSYLAEAKTSYKHLKKGEDRQTRKNLVKIMRRPSGDNSPVKLEHLLGAPELSKEFFDRMPGFTPKEINLTVDSGGGDVYASANKETLGIARKTHPTDLGEKFVSDIFVYEDPQDGQKYYKVSISVGQAASALPRIPKEIVFLVDCSYSIREKRLEAFKEGLKYWLMHLHRDDYFNIMAFKETIVKFRPSSVAPVEENIKEALRFVDQMTAGKKTDTYGALYKSIQMKNRILPSYIVLFSDGLPTQGVTNSREIINEISKLNNGKISIFTFSGGVWVNRYLLDFIAYKNRGWSEYSHRTASIRKNMAGMYDKIKDPLLTNLRYHASGVDEREIFPKLLPDFFRNIEFTLFGKYTDEDQFSVQLLGDLKGETREFLIVRSLKDAVPGDKEIARNWAFNKIYHLIGLLEYDQGNEAIITEIDFLCRKFNIKTPYASNIKK